jgi:hypothetical protein
MQRMLHGGDGRGSAFSLAALLRACDTRLVDLFEPLKSFVSFLNLGVQYEDLLRALEKQFVVSAILFQKYETCFAHLLRSNGDASVPSETERRQLFAFGWDLFLVVKSKLLAAPVDLIDAFHVLLCVVDVLLLHAPDRLRAISLDRIARVVADLSADAPDGAAPASPTLAYLCAHNRASYTDVRHVQLQMVNPLLAALRDNGILRHQPARLPPHALSANALYMGGLLDAFLAENSAAVQREYQLSQASSGGLVFDDRLFVERPEQLGSPTRVSAPTAYYYATGNAPAGGAARRRSLQHQQPPQQPPQPPPTPISAAQSTIQWLSQAVANVNDEQGPPASLVALLAPLGDAGAQLSALHVRTSELIDALELHPKARSVYVRKLFYRLLEAMLRAELARLHTAGRSAEFTALLQNEHFQRSLLACCVEIVVVAYKMPQTFPFCTRKLALVAVDMYKIIEVVLQREPSLPAHIVRHLAGVEESVLESAAWSSDSSLWQQLSDAPLDRATVRELCSWSLNDSATTAFASTAAGIAVIEATPATLAVMADAASGEAAQARTPPHSLLMLYRKLLQMVATRLFALSRQLNLPIDVFQELWSALVHALTTLVILQAVLRDRHVDQVIMCTVYGVCKVQSRALTFRAIIEAYRSAMPAAPSSVYRDVRIGDGQSGDIIQFYNTVFIPVMERPLLDLHARVVANRSTTDFAGLQPPKIEVVPSEQAHMSSTQDGESAPRAIASLGGAKLLLSPLTTHTKVIMAPFNSERAGERRGVSFALGGVAAIAEGLREINETISPRARRAPKRLFGAI